MKGLGAMFGSAGAITGVCQFFVFAISIAVICINQYQLTDVPPSSLRPFIWHSVSCAYSATGTTECNYLYAVGAVGLLFSIVIGLLQIAIGKGGGMGTHVTNIVLNCMNLGWWLAASVYFTVKFNDLPSPSELGLDVNSGIPYNYMRAINALCFTALAFATLAVIASAVGQAGASKASKEDQDYEGQKPGAIASQPVGYLWPRLALLCASWLSSPPVPAKRPRAPAGLPPPPAGYAVLPAKV
eukprot:365733-Chlamydomonas_euryale.AAC.19